jgi:glucose-6-phosphate isomerase
MSSRSLLAIDYSGLLSAGIDENDLAAVGDRARSAVAQTKEPRKQGTIGFFDLPDQLEHAKAAMTYAQGLPADIDTMVVLGIGGSSLGPSAIYAALAPPFDPLRSRARGLPRRLFFPDNSDPATFAALLEVIHLERTVFAVVTKSGGTAETAAQLLVIYDRLVKAVGEGGVKRHLIAITDPEKGPLREVAQELGLLSFPIPPSVGGRFSVLSPVGLVPAAVAGLDVMGLLDGARQMRERVANEGDLKKNPALMLAALLYLHHEKRERPMVVTMPYADALLPCADWFRQLWAESLGKKARGSTPISSRGATDQHSQLQLYAEGPDDKVYLLMAPKERPTEIKIPPSQVAQNPAYSYLVGKGVGQLLDAELMGTRASLFRCGRPHASIFLERQEAPSLGAWFMLLMAATAFAGPLYGVNPYDQPGVEEAKRLAYAALGRDGYEAERSQLQNAGTSDDRFRF